MATAATQSIVDVDKILQGYKTDGVSELESDKFVKDAIKELQDDTDGKFENNVSQVATWAIQLDEAFGRVTRGFVAFVEEFGHDFPPLAAYLSEWRNYNQRWVNHLSLSRDVASEHMSVLKRFDKIFIELVLRITTDQDRLDVIAELRQFAEEDHDRSADMAAGFLNLKNDIVDFVVRFDAYIEKTGVELKERAEELKVEIDSIKGELKELDEKIKEATGALLASAAGATTMVGVVGLVVAGTTVAIYFAQRIIKAKELAEKQKELDDINRKQAGLAKIKADFDGMKPDIALICEKLVLFAEIWTSVRVQTLQFQETLKRGLGEVSNPRFKLELQLARDLCQPLITGLDKYAKALVNRPY